MQRKVRIPAHRLRSSCLSHSLHIPGICHAVHNGTKQLDRHFEHFTEWYKKVKTLDQLIGNTRRRERYVENCLGDTSFYSEGKRLFSKLSHRLYEDRWAEFTMYLDEGMPLVMHLSRHWDEARYSRNASSEPGAEDGFRAESITPIVSDQYFRAYWRMQLALRSRGP